MTNAFPIALTASGLNACPRRKAVIGMGYAHCRYNPLSATDALAEPQPVMNGNLMTLSMFHNA